MLIFYFKDTLVHSSWEFFFINYQLLLHWSSFCPQYKADSFSNVISSGSPVRKGKFILKIRKGSEEFI